MIRRSSADPNQIENRNGQHQNENQNQNHY